MAQEKINATRGFGPNEAILAAVLASALMKVHDVPALVNKPENERADCITPVANRQLFNLNL
jgi:hypothetical protein